MENVFNVKYNTKLDRLEIPKKRGKFSVWSFIKNHKFLTIVLMNFLLFLVFLFFQVSIFI